MKLWKRYWYVPANSPNEKDVPKRLYKCKISFKFSVMTEPDTGRIEGYIYRFNCAPVLYEVLRASLIGGNNYAPLEVRDFG